MKPYRLFFVATSFLLIFSIYLINHSYTIDLIINKIASNCITIHIPNWISYILYILVPLFFTYIDHRSFKMLDHSDIKSDVIQGIEPASASFLPVFFGYIFVGLSITTIQTLLLIYCVLTIMFFCAEIYLYNPLFHLLGYKFYFVTINKNKILIMTQKKIRLRESVNFECLGRINDFTYIDLKK